MTIPLKQVTVSFPGPQGAAGPPGAAGPVGPSAGIAVLSVPSAPGPGPSGSDPEAYNLDDYGAKGDGIALTDVATTASSAQISSVSASWGPGDVGKYIVITDPMNGSITYASTILSVQDANHITLSSNVGATWTGAGCVYASDDTLQILQCVADATAQGGDVFVPPRIFGFTQSISIPGGVHLRGTSLDYSVVNQPLQKGSRLVLMANIATSNTGAVTLGLDNTSSASGKTGARMTSVLVDAQNLCDAAVKTLGRRTYVNFCQTWRGRSRSLHAAGQNSYFSFNVIGQPNTGDCVWMDSQADSKFFFNQVRQFGPGSHGIRSTNGGDIVIQGNHIFSGANGAVVSGSGSDVRIEVTSGDVRGVQILDNQLDGCYSDKIALVAGSGRTLRNVVISGNQSFMVTGEPNDTTAMVLLDTLSGGAIQAVSIVGNTAYALGSQRSKGFCRRTGTNDSGIVVSNNNGYGLNRAADYRPDGLGLNAIFTNAGDLKLTQAGGTKTLSGDGLSSSFTWPHGLDSIPAGASPSYVSITAASNDASGQRYVTIDSTNITVNFAAPPASGTNNLVFLWSGRA